SARVQFKGALHVARCSFPLAVATIDESSVQKDVGIIKQSAFGNSQLVAGPPVIAKTVVIIVGQGKVNFTRIRLKVQSGLQSSVRQVKARLRVVMASKVSNAMNSGEQTPSLQEVRIAHDGFIKQLGRFRKLLPGMDRVRSIGEERLGAQVKIVCNKIGCRCFLDRRLFARR